MTTIVVYVASSAADGTQASAGSNVDNAPSVSFASAGPQYLRFTSVAVPQGATITSANLALVSYSTKGSVTTLGVPHKCEAADNAAAITATTNLTTRSRTTASATHDYSSTAANQTATKSITGPVQEVISRAGWASGNALVVYQDAATTPGSPPYTYYTYDGDPAKAASLTIDYTAGGGSATANAGAATVSADAYNPVAATAFAASAGVADVTASAQGAIGVVPSLFTTQTPTGTNNSDGTPGITTATTVRFATAGYVTGVPFYATTTVSGTYTAALWQVTDDDNPGPGTGTLLASKVLSTSPTPGGWNTITFDTPVAVTPGVLYRAGLHSTAGRYVNTASFFTTDVVNGQITADAQGDDPVGLGTLYQGTFEINASLTYPDTTFGSNNYFIDVAFTLDPGTSTTANAGTATAGADGYPATAAVAANAGQAAVGADAYAATTTTAVTGSAGNASVDAGAYNPTVTATSNTTAGVADVGTDAYGATTTQASTAAPGTATVGVDGYNPVAGVGLSAAAADVTVAGHNPTVNGASSTTADAAPVTVDAYSATVSTTSSVTANAGAAEVVVTADNPAVAITVNSGQAAVGADAYGATAQTVAAGVASPGTAEVTADAYPTVAAPVLSVAAGIAVVGVDAYNPTTATAASTAATAGVADVGVAGHNAQVAASVNAPAGPALAGADAYGAAVVTAASADAIALVAEATVQALNALVQVLVYAGTAEVGVDAYSVPRQRRPGVFVAGTQRSDLVAGTRRSRLTAGTRRGPTYASGGTG